MVEGRNTIGMTHANAPLAARSAAQPTPFGLARIRLTEILIGTCLIESYHSFLAHGKPYPFTAPEALLPGAGVRAAEHPFQRTALLFAVDGAVPASLNKFIRMRGPNQLSADNLAQIAPELPPILSDPSASSLDSPAFSALLDALLKLDYALIVQRDPRSQLSLSHVHVKVERLTDNAIRELAQALGYIERRLFERGERYVEAIEAKFYEYYGFPPNASGRKSAAAMAAQLFGSKRLDYLIFAACQEDCRLTVIDAGDRLEHYLLASVSGDELRQRLGERALDDFAIGQDRSREGHVVAVYRLGFRRTSAALPPSLPAKPRRADADFALTRPWIEPCAEDLVPLPGRTAPAVPWPLINRAR